MTGYTERQLEPILVEMRDVEQAGLTRREPFPAWPGNAASEADQMAWNAGYSAIDIGTPMSVTVRTYDDGRITYGFAFHYTQGSTDRVSSTPPGFTAGEARVWLDGVRRAAHFLKHRPR